MVLSWLQGVDDGKVLYSTVFESLVQSILGNYVKSGMTCMAGSGLSVNISSGVVVYAGNEYNYAGGSVTLDAGELDSDRADVIVWDYNAGSPIVTVLKGARWIDESGTYKPMTERISDTQIPLAVVIVRQSATNIQNADIHDVRMTGLSKLHASQHGLGGADEVSLDASQITSGRLSLSRLPTSATANQYLVVRTANADPVWDVIKLSDLSIDIDKDWGGRSIIGLYNVSLSGELTHAGTRTEIIGFDAAGYHWVRSVSGSDNDLFMGFRRLGAGDIAIKFVASIDSKISPKVDNVHSLGSSSFRWANIYGVNVYAGDLCFEEKECAVCSQPFEVDDEIVLKAYKIDKYTRTVPIHLRCSKAYKELEVRLKLIEEKDGGGV